MTDTDDDYVGVVDERIIAEDRASSLVKHGKADIASGGVAGALLTLAVNTWVSDPSVKTTFLYAVPTIAVICSLVFRFVYGICSQLWKYFVAEIQRKNALKKTIDCLKVAEDHYALYLADPNSTVPQKKDAKDAVIKIRKQILMLMVKGVMIIR